MAGWPYLNLHQWIGCCGGKILTTFPLGQYNIMKEHPAERGYYEKVNKQQYDQVKESLDILVNHNRWVGAFIMAALTEEQVKGYGNLLENVGFTYIGNSINSRTANTIYLFMKTRDKTGNFVKINRPIT